ncbi:putative T7SS-secreted protein [Nocardioides solisilvae]|uniref:putative T7SS-secreted protein n=1 Tax=Nocardioides solisilvae TaxID=1542435 RepID=UPI000D74171B|nr:hypothetical protein [Nocardioides solisilvae]
MPDFTIRGNPGAIRSRALLTAEKGQVFYDTGDALARIDTSGWVGRAADAFRDAHDLEPERWTRAGNGFRKAGAALQVYADAVEHAQSVAEWARREHDRGERVTDDARAAYDADVAEGRAKVASGEYSSLTIHPFQDPGKAIRDNALSELSRARRDLEDAAHTCAGQVRAGCADAPQEPAWWESGLKFIGGVLQGAGEALWDLLTMIPFNPIDLVVDAYKVGTGQLTPEELAKKYELGLENAFDMAQGIYHGVTTDPLGFGKEMGKSLLDWDTWADDPARAIGHLVPDAVAAALTFGTGALATRGAKGGLDLLDGLSDMAKMDDLSDLGKLDGLADAGGVRRLDRLPDDIRDLVDKPVTDLTRAEIEQLVRARDEVTVAPGTPMQRVITHQQVEDYLRGESNDKFFEPDQTFGYTARREDVEHLRTPQDLFDGLGLDYEGTEHRAAGDLRGPNEGGTARDQIHVLRYEALGPDDVIVPRHSSFGSDGKDAGFDDIAVDPKNPFTGNGYTSGGIPEFRTPQATQLTDGAEIWRVDASGQERRVAVFGQGSWRAVD